MLVNSLKVEAFPLFCRPHQSQTSAMMSPNNQRPDQQANRGLTSYFIAEMLFWRHRVPVLTPHPQLQRTECGWGRGMSCQVLQPAQTTVTAVKGRAVPWTRLAIANRMDVGAEPGQGQRAPPGSHVRATRVAGALPPGKVPGPLRHQRCHHRASCEPREQPKRWRGGGSQAHTPAEQQLGC